MVIFTSAYPSHVFWHHSSSASMPVFFLVVSPFVSRMPPVVERDPVAAVVVVAAGGGAKVFALADRKLPLPVLVAVVARERAPELGDLPNCGTPGSGFEMCEGGEAAAGVTLG